MLSVSASRRLTLCTSGGIFVIEREAGGRGGLASGRAPFVMLTWPSPLASTVSLESPPAPMSIEPNRGCPAGRETEAAAFNTSDVTKRGSGEISKGNIEATRGWGRRSEQASRGSSSELDATSLGSEYRGANAKYRRSPRVRTRSSRVAGCRCAESDDGFFPFLEENRDWIPFVCLFDRRFLTGIPPERSRALGCGGGTPRSGSGRISRHGGARAFSPAYRAARGRESSV